MKKEAQLPSIFSKERVTTTNNKDKFYLDGGDLVKKLGVGNPQAAHAMLMTRLFEMAFKCPSSPVRIISTNLAVKFLHKNKKINSSTIEEGDKYHNHPLRLFKAQKLCFQIWEGVETYESFKSVNSLMYYRL